MFDSFKFWNTSSPKSASAGETSSLQKTAQSNPSSATTSGAPAAQHQVTATQQPPLQPVPTSALHDEDAKTTPTHLTEAQAQKHPNVGSLQNNVPTAASANSQPVVDFPQTPQFVQTPPATTSSTSKAGFAAVTPEFLFHKANVKLEDEEAWRLGRMILRVAPSEVSQAQSLPAFLLAQNVLLHVMLDQNVQNAPHETVAFTLPDAAQAPSTNDELEGYKRRSVETLKKAMAVNAGLEQRLLKERSRAELLEMDLQNLQAALQAPSAPVPFKYDQLGRMNSAAVMIQRRTRGMLGRKAVRAYCDNIMADSDNIEKRSLGKGFQDTTQESSSLERRRQRMCQRLRAGRPGRRDDTRDSHSLQPSYSTPALVLARRRCRELEASLRAVEQRTHERLTSMEQECFTLRRANDALLEANRELTSMGELHNKLEAERKENQELKAKLSRLEKGGAPRALEEWPEMNEHPPEDPTLLLSPV
ncbi:hypothetical protein CYMTET_54926 [Cymbomonas tetramitiformis]|uniref:Uncharacterized protein n=1 Tax=Cymbomonas tetramitiformis TaxID=36881 RepID=A0AAE0BDZ0_9CHLO|nr:hypothetical protein CYMTET_54926 [Cymbomonas tetramitiformis]